MLCERKKEQMVDVVLYLENKQAIRVGKEEKEKARQEKFATKVKKKHNNLELD